MRKTILLIAVALFFVQATAQVKSGTFKSAILTDLTTEENRLFKIDAKITTGTKTADVVVSLNDGANINCYSFIKDTKTNTVSEKGNKIVIVRAVNLDTRVKVYLVFTSDGKFAIRAKETQIIFLN